ncbi:MAG: hypothetical protein ACU843_08675 [Gammaproteobacteria bacterium]
MARHKNKRKAHPKSSESLVEQAALALQNGHYKDAVNGFKELLKKEVRHEWKHDLAQAYRGRALELAGKGMYEEALAVLANAVQQDPSADVFQDFLKWSVCAGRVTAALKEYFRVRDRLAKDEVDRVESMFALAALGGNNELAGLFPEDSKLYSHLPAARQAIEAYCRGDDSGLGDSLAKIPFNSPYRDIRVILAVLSGGTSDTSDGAQRLARISGTSAFKPAARLVEQALSKNLNNADLSRLSDPARTFILATRGVDPRNWNLAEKISTAPTSAKKLFNSLINESPPCFARIARDLCYRLLPQYPQGLPAYEKRIKPLAIFDLYRINALALEGREDFDDAVRFWVAAANTLREQEDTPGNRLIRAMFLRRAATCAGRGSFSFAIREQDFLEDSLELDPDDVPTYYRLFSLYRHFDDDAYRDCVERAVKQFPEDSEVLMVAIELAIERNTFKKATKFAKTLLKIDPINPRARSLLVNAHLAHAAKQIVEKKFHLVVKEIDAAEKFAPDNRPSGLIPLYRGLLEYAQGNEQQGEQLVDSACKTMGGYLSGYFRTAAEMSRLDFPRPYQKKYSSLLKKESENPPDKKTLLNLVREIQSVSREADFDFSPVLVYAKKFLSAAASLDLGCEETEMVLETFQSVAMYQAMCDFASRAVKRWPDMPLFDYYLVYARSRGIAADLSAPDAQRLNDAIDKAHEQNNIRVANRLLQYLESGIFPDGLERGASLPEQLEDEIAEFLNQNPNAKKLLEELFGEEDNDLPLPARARKGRNRSAEKAPRNLDLFDDQLF